MGSYSGQRRAAGQKDNRELPANGARLPLDCTEEATLGPKSPPPAPPVSLPAPVPTHLRSSHTLP